MSNLYVKRDHQTLGDHYLWHIDAMTTEDLRSKSAIAGELAWRDQRIAQLTRLLLNQLNQQQIES